MGVDDYTDFSGDAELGGEFAFNEKTIRLGFIRKVYSILMLQLLVTFGFIALFLYNHDIKLYAQHHPEMWWIAFGLIIVCIISLACCGEVRRKAPWNFIFLGVFTLAESFLLGAAASTYDSEEVFIAVGICAVVCLSLTLFAFQTKFDFTGWGSALFVALIVLLVFGIVAIFIPGKVVGLVYASLGALIFSMYLVYDTQLMMGGSHKYSISPEEYVFAALNLYLDVVNLFIYILHIVGAARN